MRDTENHDGLWLSEAEAMGLLDMVILSPAELTPEQRSAVHKLSDFCRQLIRRRDFGGEPRIHDPPHCGSGLHS